MKIKDLHVGVEGLVVTPKGDWMARLYVTYTIRPMLGASQPKYLFIPVVSTDDQDDTDDVLFMALHRYFLHNDLPSARETVLVQAGLFDRFELIVEALDRGVRNKKKEKEVSVSSPSMSELVRELPGAEEMVEHPMYNDGTRYPLNVVVISLNDLYKWDRVQIADWLDNLHDSGRMDLSFAGKSSKESCQENNKD